MQSVPPSARVGGLVAGKYRIDSLLGEGGMGTVWAATHVELGQPVAIKLISSELARSPDLLARFKAEAKAAAQLQSRYVVRMYDSGVTEEGRPYIAMEYLRGESLEDRLNRVGALSLAATLRIVTQVCKALKLAHAQGIIHRDLKPANIFLATSGDDEEVAKVLDFGIAKVLDHERDHGATATGIILGTPLYMSPEQARALKTLDHRSDLYSLGMVTYRMLVGDPPFHGESFGDLVYSICTKPLPSLHELVPALPPSIDAWFYTACAKEATARYSNAEQMNEALWAASGLSASHLSQVDTGGRPIPSAVAHLPITGSGTAITPSGLVDSNARAAMTGAGRDTVGGSSSGAAVTMLGPSASTNAGTAIPIKPKSSGWPILVGVAGISLAAAVGLGIVFMNKTDDADTAQGAGSTVRDGTVQGSAADGARTSAAGASPGKDEAPAQNGAAQASVQLAANEGGASTSASPSVTLGTTPVETAGAPEGAAPADSGGATQGGNTPSVDNSQDRRTPRGPRTPRTPPPTENPGSPPGKTETPDMGF